MEISNMKLNRIIYLMLFTLLVCGLSSCSENSYWDGAGGQEGFSFNASSQSFTFTNDDVMDVVEVPITRANASGEVTLPIEAEFSSSLLSGPSSVTFEDGQRTANYVITCNGFEIGDEATATLQFDKSLASAAGTDSTYVKVVLDYVWNSIGTGKFNDYVTMQSDDNYEVEFYQNETYPNRFRIMNPYKDFWSSESAETGSSMSEYVEFWVLSAGDVIANTTITQDGLVYFRDFYTGEIDADYDAEICAMHPSRLTSLAGESNWLYNKVLSYQDNGLPAQVQLAPVFYMFGVGGYNYTQYNGVITITFPDVVIYDYSAGVTYNGRSIDTDDNETVNVTVSLGADVASAKIALIQTDNPNSALSAMLSGQVETTDVEASGDMSLPLTNPQNGTYTIMLITYDENGEAQEADYAQFKYTSAAVQETWTAIATGTYTYNYMFANEDGSPYDDEGLILYQCDQDGTKYKIEHWGYDTDFTFTMDDNGSILVDEQETGVENGYGMIYVMDLVTAAGSTSMGQSSFDGSNTFNFAVYYGDTEYTYGYGTETFVITGGPSAAKKQLNARRTSIPVRKNASKTIIPELKKKQLETKFGLNNILRNFK